ncbi:hypothetical protein Mmar10_2481 [Maricaulis maris MCS10]|jgi:hypothetical protein|uniref:Sulfotransferase family protein n=1 Tax=Maricaulis maris (strain MCS10) TaxID=394221 RepID=Q0ALS4_MARMM|nr:sulfotransferase [Maricaulis maris]ABI66769.1 hypothetical protein Mmar10_2481 [Maricaulis maris MCS10]
MIPLIIIGAPRSGSTFFTTAINRHPQIFVTNELRAWNVVANIADRLRKPSEMLPEHPLRNAYAKSVIKSLVDNIREFYAQEVNKTNLGCPVLSEQHYYRRVAVFGDKNPGYADANNNGCLDLMIEALPEAKFIHVYRDPRSCITSYLKLPIYSDDIDVTIKNWLRHTEPAIALGDKLLDDRFMSVRYEDFVSKKGLSIADRLVAFLGVDGRPEIRDFLEMERAQRTPYRAPVTPIEKLGGTSFKEHLTPEQIKMIQDKCGPIMKRLGYA